MAAGYGDAHFVWCLLADVFCTKLQGVLPVDGDFVCEAIENPVLCWSERLSRLEEQADQASRAKDAMERVALDPAYLTKVVEQRNTKIMCARVLKQRLEAIKEHLPSGRGVCATLRHSVESLLVTRVNPLATQNIRKPPEPEEDARTEQQRLSVDVAYQTALAGWGDACKRFHTWKDLRGFFEELQTVKSLLRGFSTERAMSLDLDTEDLYMSDN